ncbi:uracil-DNA glycosylase [Leptospira interrogans]
MEQSVDHRLMALVAWYRDMGVSDTLVDMPLDWLALGGEADARIDAAQFAKADVRSTGSSRSASRDTPAASVATPPPRPAAPRTFPGIAPAAAEQAANSDAAAARTLDELRDKLEHFDGCALKATAKNLCFYRGAPQARLMLIGEAPGRDEDIQGKPFVGRAGQLLDRMLAAINLTEADVHITNIVYWRPPGNRTPTPQEALVCRPFLLRQIELVAPDFLLLVGGAAAKSVLDTNDGILRVRGKWRQIEVGGRTLPVIATLHPAYLLRTPAAKRQAWRDLLAVRSNLDAPRSGAN